jgi:deoxyribose-phosphate aldolase
MHLAKYIDHTNLKPDISTAQVDQLCREAAEHGFASVCIPPYYVKRAVEQLKESEVKVCTVIGFPMGYACTPAKVEEAKRAIDEGAAELDMVINMAALKAGDLAYVKNDIESVTTYSHIKNVIVKIIIEIGLLTAEEVKIICAICEEVGVDYVKTSTGVIGRAVTLADIISLRKIVSIKTKIKASAGIKDPEFARDLVEAGADRIGTSSGVSIVATHEE